MLSEQPPLKNTILGPAQVGHAQQAVIQDADIPRGLQEVTTFITIDSVQVGLYPFHGGVHGQLLTKELQAIGIVVFKTGKPWGLFLFE